MHKNSLPMVVLGSVLVAGVGIGVGTRTLLLGSPVPPELASSPADPGVEPEADLRAGLEIGLPEFSALEGQPVTDAEAERDRMELAQSEGNQTDKKEPTGGGGAAGTTPPDADGWSADRFARMAQHPPVVTSSEPDGKERILQEIRVQGIREEQLKASDPYIGQLLEEAGDLSVTAVPVDGDGNLIRNGLFEQLGEGRAKQVAPYRYVAVRPGDTLSLIAARIYHDPQQYHVIFQGNRDILRDPNRIKIGQRLRIPEDGGRGSTRVGRESAQ